RMEVVDEPLGYALRPGESDVVLLEHFEHRGAEDSDDAGQEGQSEFNGGEDHVKERVPRNRPVAVEEGVDREDVCGIGDGILVIEPRSRNRREQDRNVIELRWQDWQTVTEGEYE